MNRLRVALAMALVAVLAWTVPVAASALDPHGDAETFLTPVCTRTGDQVMVAIANPTVWAFNTNLGWTYVAFYLQGYSTGKGGYATTNGSSWYASKGDYISPSYLYNLGNGVLDRTTSIHLSGTTPDYWGVWTFVQWPDGFGEWVDSAWTGWCYA
jgi:hypothetical protein